MTRAGVSRFAVICVDGASTYWHAHADGDDPVGMIVHEVLPRAAAAGMRTGRIGLAGLSMGGCGALLLAERFSAAAGAGGPPRVGAVAALSPAIFATYPDARAANAAAFDSPADFARNDIFARLGAPAAGARPDLLRAGRPVPARDGTGPGQARGPHRPAGARRNHAGMPRRRFLGPHHAGRPDLPGTERSLNAAPGICLRPW